MDTPRFERGFDWTGPASDPNDEQFGDVVESVPVGAAGEYDAVLLGQPYDGAVIGRRGAAGGPRGIRTALCATKTHHLDAGPVRSVADLGDVYPPGAGSVGTAQDRYRSAAAAVHDAATLPVFLGGDNSLSYANVAPLLDPDGNHGAGESRDADGADDGTGEGAGDGTAAGGDGEGDGTGEGADGGTDGGDDAHDDDGGSVAVCNFDAHLDVREVRNGPTSGTPYRQLLAAGLDGYAVVGARHFETSTAYAEYLRDHGADTAVVTAEEVAEDPVAAVDRALDALDADRLYVSVDCDVLDAAAAPGVSAPTPGGLTTRELFRCLRLAVSEDRLAGAEVVECAPRLDRGERTAEAAARAVAHVLAGAGA